MGHEGHGDMDTGDSEMMPMPMVMSFHGGTNEVIVFKFWDTTNNTAAFVGSLFIIFAIAIGYEALTYVREVLYRKMAEKQANDAQNTSLLGNSSRKKILNEIHGIQTILCMLHSILSYFLMFIFMTYNSWLVVAVTLGVGVGYFCFGWIKGVSINKTNNCH